jgi:hypothetical protein
VTSADIAWYGFIAITLILLGFAALVLWKIFADDNSLKGLLSEPGFPDQLPGDTKASLSRFQFLIFTFVIAGLYLLLSIEAGTFVDIPGNVLALLGISGGTFLVSKTVSSSDRKQAIDKKPERAEQPAAMKAAAGAAASATAAAAHAAAAQSRLPVDHT